MMFKEHISDEYMINMAAEAARSMDPESYETGKIYYKSGRVEWTKLFGARIYSVVDDGKKNTVVIHIDDFSKSTCACVKKHFCEHIAAVFLHYYEPWLMSNEVLPKLHSAPGKKTSKKSPPPQSKSQALDVPVTVEGPVEHWYEYFEREYVRLVGTPERYHQHYTGYPFNEAYYLLNKFVAAITAHSKTWPSLIRSLYRLHGMLFFMTRLDKDAHNVTLSYVGKYQIKEIDDDFLEVLDSVMSFKGREKYRPFFQKAVELVRENFLRKKMQLFAWIYIYRLMCGAFLDSRELLEETAGLEEIMKGLKEDRQGHYYSALGLAGLKMSARRSDEALAVLQKLNKLDIKTEDMFFYLKILAVAKEWERLLPWLRWLEYEVKTAYRPFFEAVCEYCLLAAKNSDMGEEFIKLVRSWLPRSFDFYADYLLGTGLYREWVEFNISYLAYERQSGSNRTLRYLESRRPAVLIPFYHQWAARLIEEKKRDSYREAVSLLIKLRGLYKKQKMGQEWDVFISRLASRYPRLRAFQEEMRKGKLIS